MKLHRIYAMLLKFWYITINRPDRIFDIFYWPVIDLFVWGFASIFIKQVSEVSFLSMFLGGIVLWIFVWRSSQDIAVYILEDFWGRNLYHQYSSPVKISELLIAVMLFAFLRSVATFGVLTLLAYIMYKFLLFSLAPLIFIAAAISILSLFGWVMGLFVTSLVLRFGQRIQVLAWSSVWVVQPFSCVFYPLSALPQWAHPIAKVLPTTHVFEALRAVLSNNPVNIPSLYYAIVLTIIFLGLASLLIKKAFGHAKSSGLIARGD
jgi:ABC-2 type transport system permease protein